MPIPLIAAAAGRVVGSRLAAGAATRAGASQSAAGVAGKFGGSALQMGAMRGAMAHGEGQPQPQTTQYTPPIGEVASNNFAAVVNPDQFGRL